LLEVATPGPDRLWMRRRSGHAVCDLHVDLRTGASSVDPGAA
jgi:hypothetical protein